MLAQPALAVAQSYCAALKQIAELASGADRFASITGRQREGSFSDTSLPLPGWSDCSLYGATTYTCDSRPVGSAQNAEKLQAALVDEILSCFAGSWLHALDRSSPAYAVLHPSQGQVSMTLSIDETGSKQFVVRLTLFVRRS
jgi:hypothetical protein